MSPDPCTWSLVLNFILTIGVQSEEKHLLQVGVPLFPGCSLLGDRPDDMSVSLFPCHGRMPTTPLHKVCCASKMLDPSYQTVTVIAPFDLPEITTENLVMRPFKDEDTAEIHALRTEPELFKFKYATLYTTYRWSILSLCEAG